MKTLDKADVIMALGQGLGNLSRAARELEISRDDLSSFLAKDPFLVQMLQDLGEEILDEAETNLQVAVKAKKPWAIMFVLSTRGKGRGYELPSRDKKRAAKAGKKVKKEDDVRAEIERLRASAYAGDVEPEFMGRLDRIGPPGAAPGVGVQAILVELLGDVDRTAEALDVPRAQLMEYLARRPAVLAGSDAAREELIDNTESVLRQAVLDGKPWAVKFILTTLGRSRGYTYSDDIPEEITPDASFRAEMNKLTAAPAKKAAVPAEAPAPSEPAPMNMPVNEKSASRPVCPPISTGSPIVNTQASENFECKMENAKFGVKSKEETVKSSDAKPNEPERIGEPGRKLDAPPRSSPSPMARPAGQASGTVFWSNEEIRQQKIALLERLLSRPANPARRRENQSDTPEIRPNPQIVPHRAPASAHEPDG